MGKQEKISVEEINFLEENAKKERLTHQRIMLAIDRGCAIYDEQEKLHSADEKTMLEIIARARKSEIEALLNCYTKKRAPCRLPQNIQMEIYKWCKENGEKHLLDLMLEQCYLSQEVEEELILSSISSKKSLIKQIICHSQSELFFIEETLRYVEDIDNQSAFNAIEEYLAVYPFRYTETEAYLFEKFSSFTRGRDSVIDKAENIVQKYISSYINGSSLYSSVNARGQIALVKSGNHNLIMHLLKLIPNIDNFRALSELKERANREEIEFYYQRYSKA